MKTGRGCILIDVRGEPPGQAIFICEPDGMVTFGLVGSKPGVESIRSDETHDGPSGVIEHGLDEVIASIRPANTWAT